MHEDHLGGLTRGDYNAPDTEWSHGSIYCSEITYRLMLLRFPNLKPFMIPLEFNKDYTIESVSVRLIDANHCPGAAMILIKGSKGTVLHTGDFRYNGSKMIQDIGLSKIDYLYLDNTFSTPTEDFPAQAEAYAILSSKIKELRAQNSDFRFYLYCYTLGKEEVAINLARDFKTKIMVLKERWNRLEAIGIEDQFMIKE